MFGMLNGRMKTLCCAVFAVSPFALLADGNGGNGLWLPAGLGALAGLLPACVYILLSNYAARRTVKRQKLLIDKLNSGRKYFRLLVDTMDDAMLLVNLDGMRIVDCNATACALYGYSRNELMGMSIMELSAEPEETAASISDTREYVARRKHRRKNGEKFTVNIRNKVLEIDNQVFHVSMIRDIGDLLAAEDEVMRREESLRVTLDSIGDGVAATDTEFRITRLNPVAEQLTGWHDAEAVGQPAAAVVRIVNSFTRESMPSLLKAVAKTRKVLSLTSDIVLVSRDNREFRINYSVSPILDARDRCIGTVMVIRDVSAEYQRDMELRMWSERLRMAADVARFGIWEYSFNSGDLVVNDTWRVLYGFDGGMRLLDFWKQGIHPYDREHTMLAFNHAIRGDSISFESEFRFITPSGSVKWIYALCKVVESDSNNRPLRMIGVHQDISSRKQSEEQLVRARHSAEAANQAKGQFLATMSHEIRTPMNGIIGFVELLRESELDDTQRKYVETAARSCYALLALLNDILDFSKIESGKLQLKTERFSLRELLSSLEGAVSALTVGKNIHISFITSPDLPEWLEGDETRLRQILMNLLNNAIKFTDEGVVSMETFAERVEGKLRLEFHVRDSGIGIAGDELRRIFEKFHQLDSSPVRKYGGTGLGLSICQELAQLMGGSIDVESSVGKGSTFIFKLTLPLSSGCQSPAVHDDKPKSLKGKVLVVEDDRVNMLVLKQQLSKYGCTVEVAADGREALGKLEADAYDLVFMDCQLPVMDGYEATAAIRTGDGLNRHTPVVALTADAVSTTRDKCFEVGMDAFMMKPISVNQLLEVARRFLDKARPAGDD